MNNLTFITVERKLQLFEQKRSNLFKLFRSFHHTEKLELGKTVSATFPTLILIINIRMIFNDLVLPLSAFQFYFT